MLISLNWIREFVDLPGDLAPNDLAERFTRTTAEVDGVHLVQIGARGLTVARVERVTELSGTRGLRLVALNVGRGDNVETVTVAGGLKAGDHVVYAPTGSSLASVGTIGTTEVAGRKSAGMIVPAEAIGISMAAQEAVIVGDSPRLGEPLEPDLFDDWLIEVDNKSITHRPDLWGHYGIAREFAAQYHRPLKAYPMAALDTAAGLPSIPIRIGDADACRRYTGLMLTGVPTQPSSLAMQLRLAHVGLRPISALVDLTNFVMAELGQPMHAFDAAKVDRIETDWAQEGESFRTLDGVERKLNAGTLMIQCRGRSVAIAGIMGGHDSEVTSSTTSLLLESANFSPVTTRRSAVALGLRTDASARFEKSLDPANTVKAIRRFLHLAKPIYSGLTLTSCISDCYPKPAERVTVSVNLSRVARTIGRPVPLEEVSEVLEPMGFEINKADGDSDAVNRETSLFRVGVPSFRATGDVSIEADVIEEIARCIGYGTIAPSMPLVAMRQFEPNGLHELEQDAIKYVTAVHGFHEIHSYIWYDGSWLRQLGYHPDRCVELRNPSAEGCHRLRRSLLPGLFAALSTNRFHFPAVNLLEVGSVFEPGGTATEDAEFRHIGLIVARRGKRLDDATIDQLKGAIEGWSWNGFHSSVQFGRAAADAGRPWEDPRRTASILLDGKCIGRLSVLDAPFRRAMDEHLASWAVTWAEIRLDDLTALAPRAERLGSIPGFPRVEMDFSLLVSRTATYASVVDVLGGFRHTLLKEIRYIGAYEGERIDPRLRSLTFRAEIGDESRTLSEDDTVAFRRAFEEFSKAQGFALRQ